jgi:hypothetical protein
LGTRVLIERSKEGGEENGGGDEMHEEEVGVKCTFIIFPPRHTSYAINYRIEPSKFFHCQDSRVIRPKHPT